MKRLISLIFSAAMTLSGHAHAGPGTVSNGADWVNQFFARGAYEIDGILQTVLSKQHDELSKQEREVLQKIIDGMPQELPRSEMVEVKPSGPDFFIDGVEKIAYTGSAPGTTIDINENLIFDRGNNGAVRPLTYFQRIQILVHELAHHHGFDDHRALDQLGAKVAAIFERETPSYATQLQVRCLAGEGYYGMIDVEKVDAGTVVHIRRGIELNTTKFAKDLGLTTRNVSTLDLAFPADACKASPLDPVVGSCAATNVVMTLKGDDGGRTVRLDEVRLDLRKVETMDAEGMDTKIEATLFGKRADNGQVLQARTGQNFEVLRADAISACFAR